MTTSPSRELRTHVVNRLSDEVIGFNACLVEAAAAYSVDSFTIDFDGTGSNFFQAYIDPKRLPDVTDIVFPVMCVFVTNGANTGDRAIGTAFDGDVVVGVDVHLAWDGLESLVDFESHVDAVEAALITTFNLTANPDPLLYLSYTFSRTPLTPTKNTWVSTFSLRMTASVTES